MNDGDDAARQRDDGLFAAGVCLLILLVWALLAFLPGLVLGILISLAWHGEISRATVSAVTVVTAVMLHVIFFVLASVGGRHDVVDIDPAAAERLAKDPEIDFAGASYETIKRVFPHLEFIDAEEAYLRAWVDHFYSGSAFLSELRYFGVDAELTRCWWLDSYSPACEITVSGQLITSIVLADWDGMAETEFLIPDPRVEASTRKVRLGTVHSKTFPVFGQVRGVVWKGADHGTGLKTILNGSPGFREILVHQYELNLALDNKRNSWVLTMDGWPVPTQELWRCYLSIADLLLRSPLPASLGANP
jgi:hypothetical protein